MNEKIKNLVTSYWRKEISQENLVVEFEKILSEQHTNYNDFFKSVIESQNADVLKYFMTIGYALNDENGFIDFVHKVISAPWHRSYEEMAHFLQRKKKPESVEYLKRAMQKRYAYLESYGTGTRQFINQCGHALWSIGTNEAINSIRELTKSDDPIIRDEMLYRVSRIENRNNYERNFDLE